MERIKEVYQANDRNKDGYLDHNEVFMALRQLGHTLDQSGMQRVINLMDKNGDGVVSFNG